MSNQPAFQARPVPTQAGIGLRPAHFRQVLDEHPPVPWFEVHSENFFCAGGEMLQTLDAVRRDYPISLHGVGLSLGSSHQLSERHLANLRQLIGRVEPALVSEHLCWGAIGERHLNDLLPLPYTEEALDLMVSRVTAAQEFLERTLLLENVSTYLTYRHSTIPEAEFIAALAERSGCHILLDVNNIYVNATNHGYDAGKYIHAIPKQTVKEIHLAGFTRKEDLPVDLLIDSHSRPVADEVWRLYRLALNHCGPVPTLIEWDQDIPPLHVLLAEAAKAEGMLHEYRALAA
ncbi:MAG: MNIO family bufferin maturase [Gammaproteobacteria bacterium]